MKKEILIVGTGGQGIKTIGKLIACAVAQSGLFVSFYPVYTPRARGGEIVSSIVISNKPITHPLVQKADIMLVLSMTIPKQLVLPKLHPDTKIFFEKEPENISEKNKHQQKIKGLIQDPFSNVVILGFIQKLIPEIPEKLILEEIQKFSPNNLKLNKANFILGQNLI